MVDTAGPLVDEKRATFFRLIFGKSKGIMCLAFLTTDKQFREEFFDYPGQLDLAIERIAEVPRKTNVYFCSQLLRERKREKSSVSITPNVWADLDSCEPSHMKIEPSVTLETSPGRYQAFWLLDKLYDPDDVEEISRRVAYAHAQQGADRSGWDLTQLLRVPYTYNYKHFLQEEGNYAVVNVLTANRNKYSIDTFDAYYESTDDYVRVEDPMPDLPRLDGYADDLLQQRRLQLSPIVWALFSEQPDIKADWSALLWRFMMMLFEAGYTREDIFVIAREAKCNKWARDGKPAVLLWKEVCRAQAKHTLNERLLVSEPEEVNDLMSQAERDEVDQAPVTFVERYHEWATKLGDAAPQYHQAGAFAVLSSILAGSVRLPTSYGTIIPNLWFMILADTTLTRKTTAMDIAMDLVGEVDEDVVMATDGSLEGLLTALGARPGRPSIFLRDEFSGLLEQMTKKDYMAGMPELLTKLYDGKFLKRLLRKETIEVRDPRLILFAGGIKNKVTSLLTFEMVSSGFMPRFIFITAESDLSRVRPVGPPQQSSTGVRDAILDELNDLHRFYNQVRMLKVEKLKTEIPQQVVFDAEMTDEAWIRYNELENRMLEIGLKSQKPEIMTPVGDRLSKSILKAALLLAASRQREEVITVTRLDILRAMKYGEQWLKHAQDVMSNIGKGAMERQLDIVLRALVNRGGESTRSSLMQTYHLTARDASAIFETLEQRGLITRTQQGRSQVVAVTKMGTTVANVINPKKQEEKKVTA